MPPRATHACAHACLHAYISGIFASQILGERQVYLRKRRPEHVAWDVGRPPARESWAGFQQKACLRHPLVEGNFFSSFSRAEGTGPGRETWGGGMHRISEEIIMPMHGLTPAEGFRQEAQKASARCRGLIFGLPSMPPRAEPIQNLTKGRKNASKVPRSTPAGLPNQAAVVSNPLPRVGTRAGRPRAVKPEFLYS